MLEVYKQLFSFKNSIFYFLFIIQKRIYLSFLSVFRSGERFSGFIYNVVIIGKTIPPEEIAEFIMPEINPLFSGNHYNKVYILLSRKSNYKM